MKKKQQLPKQINTPNYSYWQALYMAFYSRRLYVDIVKRWPGFGCFYFLLLISIASIPISIRFIIDFNQYFNEQLIMPIKKIPPLYIHNGIIVFNKAMPYVIKDNMGEVVGLIDTRDESLQFDSRYPNLAMIITKDTLYFKMRTFSSFLKGLIPTGVEEEIVAEKLDEGVSEVFVPETWLKASGVLRLKWITDIMIYPLFVAFFFGLYFTVLLAITMLAQTVAWLIFKCRLTFKETARLLMVSSSPHVMALLSLLSVNALFPGAGLLCFVLGVVYFSYGVLSFRRESRSMVRV
jgi:hypothetical protein